FDFDYNDADGWPGRADGKGASLVLIAPDDVPDGESVRSEYLSDPDNWQSSVAYLGTPGTAAEPHQGVVINEVLSHTDWPQVDAIELVNVGGTTVDLGGWFLSDSWGWESNSDNGDYKKFRIPNDTTLAPGQYVTFDENDFNPTPVDPLPAHFALDGAYGDDVWLMRADTQGNLTHFGDHVDLGAQTNGESWGRWADGGLYPMTRVTPDGPNSGPRLGSVIVSEVYYNPGTMLNADDLEFVEIYNSGTTAVDLTDWRLDKAVDYDFPSGTMLGALDTAVVVAFDPVTEPLKLAAFTWHHNIQDSIDLFGPYGGQLRDDGERVQLQYPDEEPADEPGFIPHLLEDEVIYDDDSGWPLAADGSGNSLHRVTPATWGNDPAHWTAASPTPGLVQFGPYVAGRHVFYNESTAAPADDNAIATDKRALLPGGVADFSNYTSYALGINGIMVDLANLPDGVTPTADDFQFRFGTASSAAGGPGDTPADWPMVSPESVTVRPGDGDSTRVTITFNSGELRNGWLQVTVASDTLGLAGDDVFYYGNAVAESGNSPTDARVTTSDLLLTRNNPRDQLTPAAIDNAYDCDRDGAVNATDVLLARNNQTNFLSALNLIDLSGSVEEAQGAPPAALVWLTDLGQPTTHRPAEKDGAVDAVDLLLATLWP
ncbi:MAG: lamin tail domain-containing protein, partial [Candidatus Nealsonbacteria bacterium]|nr:lamin tail domain-containing protein [Candidatus Nealsonbacteria bacterium]